jgi:predicted anti-sigma-YlaC factor YlaD
MNHFCRQASRLLSERYERRLTPVEQTRLQLHLLLCGMCRNYAASLALMQQLFEELQEQLLYPPLPEAVRQRILHKLESES